MGLLDSNALNLFVDGSVVKDDERYRITDLELKSSDGIVKATVSQTVLRPGMETRGHRHDDQTEVYYFLMGSGEMILDGKKMMVTTSSAVYVESGVFHQVRNLHNTTPLIFLCFFENKARRPEF